MKFFRFCLLEELGKFFGCVGHANACSLDLKIIYFQNSIGPKAIDYTKYRIQEEKED